MKLLATDNVNAYSELDRKTSCAFALADFFGVDVYARSLNDPDTTEGLLVRLMPKLPPYCIVLLEDIKVANFPPKE